MVNTYLIIGAGGIIAGLLTILGAYGYVQRDRPSLEEEVEALTEQAGDEIALKPPDIGRSILGALALWRHKSKEQKLARKGYVKWYRLGAGLSRPKWVKPSQESAGLPEITSGGEKYYFPTDALVVDSTSGAYVAIHEEGSAMPLNLADPPLPPVPVELLQRVIDLEAESEAPGWLSGLSITPKKLLWGFIGFILVFSLVMQVFGGGL
jgi:hypothetical protein